MAEGFDNVVRILATYTAPPVMHTGESSKVCRDALGHLLFSARLAFPEVEAVVDNKAIKKNGKARRLLETLWLRLAYLFQYGNAMNVDPTLETLHTTGKLPPIVQDVVDVLSTKGSVEHQLQLALAKVGMKFADAQKVDGAVDFLLGLRDSSDRAAQEKLPQVISVWEDTLTLPLPFLLSCSPGETLSAQAQDIFNEGQLLLANSMEDATAAGDDAVLERAYLWILGCKWAQPTEVPRLGVKSFRFQPTLGRLQDGLESKGGARIFSKNGKVNEQGMKNIQPSVLYHAASEGKGSGSHRGCDLWFLTHKNELILVDVTGSGNREFCQEKADALTKCVEDVESNIGKLEQSQVESVFGVVLAPNCRDYDAVPSSVQVITSSKARDLIGGLQQIVSLIDPESPGEPDKRQA